MASHRAEDHPVLQAVADASGGVTLQLHVQPGARRPRLCGMHGEALKLAVHAPPRDGQANAAVIAALAEGLAWPKSEIRLVSGAGKRSKRVLIHGDAAVIRQKLIHWFDICCGETSASRRREA